MGLKILSFHIFAIKITRFIKLMYVLWVNHLCGGFLGKINCKNSN